MDRTWFVAAALAASVALPAALGAHAGHVHKVMGTVSLIHEAHLEVKDLEGKVVTVTVNAKTKILRGKAKASTTDIQAGERVVVSYQTQEKDKVNVATTIQLPVKKVPKT